MGLQSLHGDPILITSAGATWASTPLGPAWYPTTSTTTYRWANRMTATTNKITLVYWAGRPGNNPFAYCTPLGTRESAFPLAIMMSSDGTKHSSNWNDDSTTYSFTGGPVWTASDEMVAWVSTGTQLQWFVNGVLGATQTYTPTALNFANTVDWWAGESGNARTWQQPYSLFYVYDRALSATEVDALWGDPFCFLRR
jgi:hypothetical protein